MATAQSPVRLSQKRDRQRFFRGHDSRWKGFPHFRSPHYGCYNSEATGSIHLIVQSFNTMAHHVRSHYYIFLRIHVYAHTILLSQYKHIILCDEWVIVRPSRAVVFCRIGFIPTSIEQMQKTFNSWWHKIHSTRKVFQVPVFFLSERRDSFECVGNSVECWGPTQASHDKGSTG